LNEKLIERKDEGVKRERTRSNKKEDV